MSVSSDDNLAIRNFYKHPSSLQTVILTGWKSLRPDVSAASKRHNHCHWPQQSGVLTPEPAPLSSTVYRVRKIPCGFVFNDRGRDWGSLDPPPPTEPEPRTQSGRMTWSQLSITSSICFKWILLFVFFFCFSPRHRTSSSSRRTLMTTAEPTFSATSEVRRRAGIGIMGVGVGCEGSYRVGRGWVGREGERSSSAEWRKETIVFVFFVFILARFSSLLLLLLRPAQKRVRQ